MYLVINKETSDEKEFISFWSERYKYKLESKYSENIAVWKNDKTNYRLMHLFVWKNGMNFENHKNKKLSFQNNIISNLDIVKQLPFNFKIEDYLELSEFKNWENIVWKVFLLHCLNHTKFPIYDQHVHRAFDFIKNNGNIKKTEFYYSTYKISEKLEFYTNEYIPFVIELKTKSKLDFKQIDEALVTFGKFLNDYNF